jgi:hypothetical protein
MFIVQLVIYGARADRGQHLPEQPALARRHRTAWPDGIYGQYLTYLLVVLPLGWLASNLFRRTPTRARRRRDHALNPP